MHCPFLCRHLNKKRANQNQHSPQQQRNWLDELVFNYLDFVPLDPNTTPYYKKNTRNLRSTPKRVLPSWLQGPQHLNYKHDAHQVHNYGQSRNSVPLAQTEGQKYLFEKMEIQRAYRIVPPFSKQKNTTKIVKDEKVDERLEYKSKNLSTQAETVAWRLSAKSSHVIKSKSQLIKDDKNQLIVLDESKIKRPERLYYKPFSKRKSMEIKDIEAELKNYRRSASQKNMRLRLQEQQLIELYSLQNMAKPKKKQVKAKNLGGITNKWNEDIEKKDSKLTSTQQLIKDDKNQLIVLDESKIKRPERLYYKPFSKRKSMEIKDIEAELKNYRRSASQKNMRLRLQEQQLIEFYSLQNMAKPKKKQVKAKNLEGITNKWNEDIEKKVSKLTSTQPSNGGRNFKMSETSMNNESKPKATMRMVSEKKAMEIEYNIEDLLTDEIAKTPKISDYNIPSVKKKKRTQQKLFHLDVSVYPVKKSKKNHNPKDYPNKVQNKNKLNKLAAQAATKYIIKKMQRNNLANAPVGVPEQNKTNKGKSKAAIAAAKAPKETNKEIQGNSSDDSIDKLIKSYSMRYIHNKNRISSSRRASAKSILKKISAVHKANEITKPKEINAQKENPIKVEANTSKVVQLNEKRTGSFTRKSIPSNRIDGRRSVRQSIKLQRLLDKRMEPRYKEYLKKLDEYDNEKLKASESGTQLHSDKNLYKSLDSTMTIDNDLRSATSLSERFYESETTFSENQRHNAAERTKLENEIRELMQIVETRDELPVKKIQRNFVLEAQTQSWPTKRPRIEKAAKLKRFKLATKWEKIYLPESPKPIMLRRYCRKPPPRPPPPELPVVEPAKCACASRQHLELGKLEDDPPFIREMKAAWQKLQLKNYYRFIIRRSALECQEPSQFENKCSHNQIICS